MKRKNFIAAYARLTAHFGIINSDYGEKFARTAEDIYGLLSANGKLGCASDVDALTAVIYYKSGIKEPLVNRENLCEFFDAKEKKIAEILEEL